MYEELNKKLAKWAGFTKLRMLGSALCGLSPTAKEKGYKSLDREPVPNFTESLDACFKWLVPKAIHKIMARLNWSRRAALNILFANWRHELENEVEQPALALCLAIIKLIDEKD